MNKGRGGYGKGVLWGETVQGGCPRIGEGLGENLGSGSGGGIKGRTAGGGHVFFVKNRQEGFLKRNWGDGGMGKKRNANA